MTAQAEKQLTEKQIIEIATNLGDVAQRPQSAEPGAEAALHEALGLPVRYENATSPATVRSSFLACVSSGNNTLVKTVRAWQRVETWLAENAPGSHRSLRPPATDLDIAHVHEYVPLHEDLRTLLALHDGTEAYEIEGDEEGEVNPAAWLPGSAEWLPLNRVLALPAVAPAGPRRPDRAPWAAPGDGHYGLAVEGASGHVTRFPDEGLAPLKSTPSYVTSLAAYLTAFAEALESGTGPLIHPRSRPGIAFGCLLWEDPERVSLDDAPWHPLHL